MNKFEFPHPESPQPDQLRGLSDRAIKSLANIAQEFNTPNQLFTIESEVHKLNPILVEWCNEELESKGGAFENWNKYHDLIEVKIPQSIDELAASNPNFIETINRLYKAKLAIQVSKTVNPNGINISEVMQLVLIPWQEIRNNLSTFDLWIDSFRPYQGLLNDDIGEELLTAIKKNHVLYRSNNDLNVVEPLRTIEYLDSKIKRDGPWGLMLAQTSKTAGTDQMTNQSPDTFTRNGKEHLYLYGQAVDNMGIFEWLALTIQNPDPVVFSPEDSSWLLANRVISGYKFLVPRAFSSKRQIVSMLSDYSDYRNQVSRPRLAVM